MCLGGTYAWTDFASSISKNYPVDESTVRLPFTVFYSAFPLTVVFLTVFFKRLGTRIGAMLGGGLFGLGWIIASFGAQNFWFTIIGAGVVGGVGVGIAYVIPISVCIALFPKKRGLVTGLIVGGFAGGAAIVSQVTRALTTSGTSAFTVLMYCGIAFLIFSLIAGSFMSEPEGSSSDESELDFGFVQLLKNPIFLVLFVAMIIGLIAGFFINVNLKQFADDNALAMTLTGAAIFSIGNAFGRIIWGAISDHSSAGRVLRWNLGFQAVMMICAVFMVKSLLTMSIFAALTGFNYGGVLVLYASAIGKIWGNAAVRPIYSKIFISNIIASWLMVGVSYLYDASGMVLPSLVVAVVLIVTIFWSLKVLPNSLEQKSLAEF